MNPWPKDSKKAATSDIYYHTDLLKNITKKKKAKIILELGVRTVESGFKKTSTTAFLEAVSEIGGKLYSIDLCEPIVSKKDHVKKLIKQAMHSNQWHFFLGNTMELFPEIKKYLDNRKEKVDILFIDTHKTYELTNFELENYTKLLSNDGIILMHDVGVHLLPKWRPSGRHRHKIHHHQTQHDKAVKEFLDKTDFNIKGQLGSYNLATLYRDEKHLKGVKVDYDLPYNYNRQRFQPGSHSPTRRHRWEEYFNPA